MTAIKGLNTRFIAGEPGADLKIYLSGGMSKANQTNIPIHKPLDTRGGHTSMGTVPNMGRRWQSKVWDTCNGCSADGMVVCTRRCILGPWGGTGFHKGVGNTTRVRKGGRCVLRVRLILTEPC